MFPVVDEVVGGVELLDEAPLVTAVGEVALGAATSAPGSVPGLVGRYAKENKVLRYKLGSHDIQAPHLDFLASYLIFEF